MAWLRKFWPSSLYGQLLAVVALALLLAQAANTRFAGVQCKARAVIEASSMLVARVSNQIERQSVDGISMFRILSMVAGVVRQFLL